ncbi:hypothetical protein F511_42663 [Dorcoceras hygrometricum]|uniref:Uncharacterized protein n=1 Tax=Dorcoceras hygrometricum TaxID=472368 RepID=A0A2Z7D6Z0_9LAMI|nr:hypothetical protein F511_42663 [Dorcoceras hygrometricum]
MLPAVAPLLKTSRPNSNNRNRKSQALESQKSEREEATVGFLFVFWPIGSSVQVASLSCSGPYCGNCCSETEGTT